MLSNPDDSKHQNHYIKKSTRRKNSKAPISESIPMNTKERNLSTTPDAIKQSFEGLSACEVDTFVPEQYTPDTIKGKGTAKPKQYSFDSNVEFGSGLASAKPPQVLLQTYENSASIKQNSTTVDLPTKSLEVAAASGDIFMTG